MAAEVVLLLVLSMFTATPCAATTASAAVVSAASTPSPMVMCANSGEAFGFGWLIKLSSSDRSHQSLSYPRHYLRVFISDQSSIVFVAAGTTPVMLGEPLGFCGNTGISCCDSVIDDELREELVGLHISDATCAAIVKSFLCARCIPSLSFVFSLADPSKLSVPLLCAQQQPVVSAGTARPGLVQKEQDTMSMCLERISAASFHAMTAHPDGSDHVFLTSRGGKLWLATMPRRGAGAAAALRINDGGSAGRPRPFLDLTDRVQLHHHEDVLGGMTGVAFHPEFTTNGRFFVSYICDSRSVSSAACAGAANGSGQSHRYHLVVAEFSAQAGAGADFSKATQADPSEVRRIFTLGLPQPQYKLYSYQGHGGQILFRPGVSDGYLYLITGYGYSSKKKSGSSSFFGKILRFNVDTGPGVREWSDTDRQPEWTDKPEVFAAGLSNPSSCSFDYDRPSHLYCADVNAQRSERVYLIRNQMGGRGSSSSSVSIVVNRGHPTDGRMPSIVGGLVYQGSADTSLKGRYLYVYTSAVWSGHYASAYHVLNISCSWSSPVPCHSSGMGIGSRVLSMAEDNSKDAFFLTTAGVFRVVPSGACGARPLPQLPAATGWQLAGLATAMALAFFVCWTMLGGCGGPQIHVEGCCNNSISCCSGRKWYQILNSSPLPHQN